MLRHVKHTTLSGAIENLRIKKIDKEFHVTNEGFVVDNGKVYHPNDLKIVNSYRFEGETDPADSSVLYVLKAKDGLIGYLLFSIMNKVKKIRKTTVGKFLLPKRKSSFRK